MKYFLTLLLIAGVLPATAPAHAELIMGMTKDQVVEALGKPEGEVLNDNRELLFYGNRSVELLNGRLVIMDKDVEEWARKRQAERELDAAQRAKGLVKHGDRWITRAELARLERAKRARAAKAPPRPATPVPAPVVASGQPNVKRISNGGRQVSKQELLVPGKVTIVDFYADWCGPCRRISPHLEKLAGNDPDVLLRKVDIVKWGTPVTKQYGIRSVPNVRVFDRSGKMVGQPTSNLNHIRQFVSRAK